MAAILSRPLSPFLQSLHLLPHGARVGDDGARPVEHPLALRGEAQEARGPLHQHDAQRVLELLDAGREGRLGHAAGLGGAAEVALASQRQQIFELVDHPPSQRLRPVTLSKDRRCPALWNRLAGGRAASTRLVRGSTVGPQCRDFPPRPKSPQPCSAFPPISASCGRTARCSTASAPPAAPGFKAVELTYPTPRPPPRPRRPAAAGAAESSCSASTPTSTHARADIWASPPCRAAKRSSRRWIDPVDRLCG